MGRLRWMAVIAFVALAIATPATARAGPHGLPAPVALETSRAVHTLLPSGRIVASRARRPARCGGTTWSLVAGQGACLVQRDGRVAVVRNCREVWRSAERYRLSGLFAKLGPRAVALSYDSDDRLRSTERLLIAPLGGRERAIAGDERPLGSTRQGELLTWRFRQRSVGVYVRTADGTVRRRLAAGLADIRWDARTHTLFMLSRGGVLSSHDGARRQRLAELRSLGFRHRPTIQLLEGSLIGVLGRTRVAVLRRDGSVFASALLRPHGGRFSVAANSGLVADRAGTAVAFTVTEGNVAYRPLGRESLYVLREADRHASRLHSRRLRFALCARWNGLSWSRDWLLYTAVEGTIAIDTMRLHRRIDLTAVVDRVSGDRIGEVRVRWGQGGGPRRRD